MAVTTKNHELCSIGARHPVVNLEYPTAADRILGSNEVLGKSLTADQIGEVARQLDDRSLWVLDSISPIEWFPFAGATVFTTVNDVTELEALDLGAGREGDLVDMKYHTTDGDGGGGFFRFVNDASLSADNGLTFDSGRTDYYFVRVRDRGPINVRWFGAQADWNGSTGTDDAAAVQAALDALAVEANGTTDLYIPAGKYRIATELNFPSYNSGSNHVPNVRIYGDGRNDFEDGYGTWLYADMSSGHLISTAGAPTDRVRYVSIEKMSIFQTSGSGATADDLIAVDSSATFFDMDRVCFALQNPAARFLYIPNAPGQVRVERVRGFMATAASVPAIEIRIVDLPAPESNVFAIKFRDCMINSNATATAPIFYIVGEDESNVSFDNVVLEVAGGGGIHTESIRRAVYSNVWAVDLAPTTPSAPIISIDKTPTGETPQDHTFIGCTLLDGTNAQATCTIYAAAGAGYGVPTLIGTRAAWVYGAERPTALGCVNVGQVSTGAGISFIKNGWINNIAGIAADGSFHRNLRGSFTISDTNTQAVVTFPFTEGDTNYYIIATLSAQSAAPAAGSNRIATTVKNAANCVFNVETAPGTSESVTFDWFILR